MIHKPTGTGRGFCRERWRHWLAWTGEHLGWSYSVSERELQRSLARSFPLTGGSPLGRWALSDPAVSIGEDERLTLELAFGMGTGAVEAPAGRVRMAGAIRYSSNEGAFYVDDLQVLGFSLNQWEAPLLPVRLAVEQALRLWFRRNPVFRLDGGRRSHLLLRHWLRRVQTRRGRLLLRLGRARVRGSD